MNFSKLKKIAATGIAVTLTASFLTGCGIKSDTFILGKIFGLSSDEIFKIDDLTCSKSEYKLIFMNYVNKYKKDFGGKVDWNAKVDKDTTLKDFVMEKVKEDMTVKYTIAAMADSEGIKIDKDDMRSINDVADKFYNSLSQSELEYTDADLDTATVLYRNYYLADKVYNRVTEKVDETVSEEDARVIKIQYIRMSSDNTAPDTIQKKLRSIAKKVKKGTANFEKEAKQISEDDSATKVIKKNEATTTLEKEAFNVNKNQTSEIINDGNDYYLIYCVDNYMKDETAKNKEDIIKKQKKALFQKEYNSFLKDSSYDFNTSEWEDIVPEDIKDLKLSNFFSLYGDI